VLLVEVVAVLVEEDQLVRLLPIQGQVHLSMVYQVVVEEVGVLAVDWVIMHWLALLVVADQLIMLGQMPQHQVLLTVAVLVEELFS
jgi:hypothetical protein